MRMLVFPLILDTRPPYLGAKGASILSLPLGTGTILSDLTERLHQVGGSKVRVLPTFQPDERYVERMNGERDVEILDFERLATALAECEPSDDVIVLDPRYWPTNGFDVAGLMDRRQDRRWTVCAVANSTPPAGKRSTGGWHGLAYSPGRGRVRTRESRTHEYARRDSQGRVRCVQRYYEEVTWPRTGPIYATLAPVSAMASVCGEHHPSSGRRGRPRTLLDLRNTLCLRGMLSQDVCFADAVVDLSDERGFLALQERRVIDLASEAPPPGYVSPGEGILVARDARVHPSARIIGPVVIQSQASVGQACTIVGPSTIGARSRCRAESLLAQCAVMEGTTLPLQTTIRHRVVTPENKYKQAGLPSLGGAARAPAPEATSAKGSAQAPPRRNGTRNGDDRPSHNGTRSAGNGHAAGGHDAGAGIPSGALGREPRRYDPIFRRPQISSDLGTSSNSLSGTSTPARRSSIYPFFKLAFEVGVATLALIVLAPLFILLAIAIKLESPGPVFYLDDREGKDGRPFRCAKFRTMRKDAHKEQRRLYAEGGKDGRHFKMADDPRITWLGRCLRQTNLDELPQLINVMLGQMSLVGPRPSPFRENQICVPWRRIRLSVRPGITGLWQVCRHDRDEADFHQWIAYDIAYVRHQSFLLDMKIIVATILTVGAGWNVPESWILGRHRISGRLGLS